MFLKKTCPIYKEKKRNSPCFKINNNSNKKKSYVDDVKNPMNFRLFVTNNHTHSILMIIDSLELGSLN